VSIEIRVLLSGDEQLLMSPAAEVFDSPPDAALTREFLDDPRHHMVVAVDDGQVVGFASGVHYIHPDKPAELFINEVAVASTHRGCGLGKSLLRALLDVGRAQGCILAWVLTDGSNAGAKALYESLGGRSGREGEFEDVVGFSFLLGEKAPNVRCE